MMRFPQFYLFTFVASAMVGWLAHDYYLGRNQGNLFYIAVLFVMIYANEKTALFEKLKKKL